MTTLKLIDNKQKITLTKFFQNLYGCPSPLGLMQIECNFFIDSLRCYFSEIYVQYISTIEYGKDRKKIKTGSELMKYVRCERPISHYSLYISLLFIHEKTSAIYRIADHTSVGNV